MKNLTACTTRCPREGGACCPAHRPLEQSVPQGAPALPGRRKGLLLHSTFALHLPSSSPCAPHWLATRFQPFSVSSRTPRVGDKARPVRGEQTFVLSWREAAGWASRLPGAKNHRTSECISHHARSPQGTSPPSSPRLSPWAFGTPGLGGVGCCGGTT